VEEYTRLPARLRLNGAICLNPLTPEQVDAYLQAGGAQLAALRASLQSDDGLAVLAQTPLFLSIMCLAYQDLKPEQLVSPAAISVEERRQHLFEHYVGRMLKRKGQRPGRAGDARLLSWLSWLARHMTARNLSVFLSERLQPDWIDDDRGRWLYALASRLSLWLSLGLGMTLAWLALSATLYAAGGSVSDYLASMFSGPLLLPLLGQTGGVYRRYVTPGVVAGLILGVRFAFMALRGQVADKQASGWRRASVNVLLGIGVPVLAATLPNIVQLLTPGFSDVAGSLIGMSTYWGLVMLLAAIAFRARGQGDSLAADIPTVDSLDWSWLQSLRGVVAGFISGAVLAAAFAAVTAWSFRSLELLVVMTICSVPGGLLGALTAGAVAGLRGRAAPELPKTQHWVARHVRNALTAGTLLGLVLGLSGTLVGLAIFYLPTFIGVGTAAVEIVRSAALGVMTGAVAGTVAALHFGGAGLIQRAALRLVLVVRRHTPWRISRLADQAEDLVLLRRVGSGYIFIHRLVMEYFAGLKLK
jgi:hypothetical protein